MPLDYFQPPLQGHFKCLLWLQHIAVSGMHIPVLFIHSAAYEWGKFKHVICNSAVIFSDDCCGPPLDHKHEHLSTHRRKTKTPHPHGKSRMHRFSWAKKMSMHVIVSCAVCVLCYLLMHPLHRSPRGTHPPAETFFLFKWDYITPVSLPPPWTALRAGPRGGRQCGKQTFSLVRGMLLMRWGNGSPHCAHRDTEDKSDSW